NLKQTKAAPSLPLQRGDKNTLCSIGGKEANLRIGGGRGNPAYGRSNDYFLPSTRSLMGTGQGCWNSGVRMAGLGESDRYRTAMFENSNRIRFVVEIRDEDRKWWLTSIYDRFGLTPEDIGDRLSASWSG